MPLEAPPSTDHASDSSNGLATPKVIKTREEQIAHDRDVFKRLQGAADQAAGGEPTRQTGQPAASPPPATSKSTPSNPPASGAMDDADKRELETIAESVFKRDGLSEKARKALIANLSPEELRADIDKRRKVQGDVDRLGNEAADLRRRQAGNPQDPKAKKGDPSQAGAGQDDLADLSPKQRAVIEKVRAEGDDGRASELLEAMREGKAPRQRADDANNPNAPADRPSKEEEHETMVARAMVRFREPLDQLEAKFPGLKSSEDRRKLINRANRLLEANAIEGSGPNGMPTPTELFEKAALLQYGTLPSSDPTAAQRDLIQSNRRERSGQPDPTDKGGTPPVVLDGKARDREAFRRLSMGEDPDTVRRELAKAR